MEEDLSAQGLCAQDLGVDRKCEHAQAAGGVQEEGGRVVHLPGENPVNTSRKHIPEGVIMREKANKTETRLNAPRSAARV